MGPKRQRKGNARSSGQPPNKRQRRSRRLSSPTTSPALSAATSPTLYGESAPITAPEASPAALAPPPASNSPSASTPTTPPASTSLPASTTMTTTSAPQDERAAFKSKIFAPHYSDPHASMIAENVHLFEGAIGSNYLDVLKNDLPQTYEDAEFFNWDLFNNPGLIKKDTLPKQGYQGFILASLDRLQNQDPDRKLSFKALFGYIKDRAIGRAVVKVTGEPRYLDMNLPHFNDTDFWKSLFKHRAESYQYLTQELRSELELAEIVCDHDPKLYQFTCGDVKKNVLLAIKVCRHDGLMLAYCSKEFRGHVDIITAACENNAEAAKYITPDFAASAKQLKKVKQIKMKNLPEEFLLNDRVLVACSDAGIWDDEALTDKKLQEWKDKLFFAGTMEGQWASSGLGSAYLGAVDMATAVPDIATPATDYSPPTREAAVSAMRSTQSQSPEESAEHEEGAN